MRAFFVVLVGELLRTFGRKPLLIGRTGVEFGHLRGMSAEHRHELPRCSVVIQPVRVALALRSPCAVPGSGLAARIGEPIAEAFLREWQAAVGNNVGEVARRRGSNRSGKWRKERQCYRLAGLLRPDRELAVAHMLPPQPRSVAPAQARIEQYVHRQPFTGADRPASLEPGNFGFGPCVKADVAAFSPLSSATPLVGSAPTRFPFAGSPPKEGAHRLDLRRSPSVALRLLPLLLPSRMACWSMALSGSAPAVSMALR